MKKNVLSRKYIIKLVQLLSEKKGSTITRREFPLSAYHYEKYFGNWNNTLKAAKVLLNTKTNLSDKDILNCLNEFKNKYNRTPNQSDFYASKIYPDPTMVSRRFGSWNRAINLAGLEVNRNVQDFSDFTNEELLEKFKEEYIKTHSQCMKDYEEKRGEDNPSLNLLKRRLKLKGNEILKLCNFSIARVYNFSEKELLDEIRNVASILNKTPSMKEFTNKNQLGITADTIKQKFPKWNRAIELANLDIINTQSIVSESNKELLEKYIKFSNKINKSINGASSKDLDTSNEIYNADVFVIRFGSIRELKELAGFQSRKMTLKYSKEEIAKLLIEEYRNKGRELKINEIKKSETLPSVSTILRRFKTTKISKVWEIILDNKI